MHTDWKERLNNWSPEPPQGGWERLSEALEHEAKPVYAQKLYEFATPPPPAVWQAVASELDAQQTATGVIQMYPRKRWLQVASIAASLLFAIYFLPPLFKKDQPSTTNTATSVINQSIVPIPKPVHRQEASGPRNEPLASTAPAPKPAEVYFTQMPLPPKSSEPLPVAETERATSVLRSWLPENDGLQQIGDRMERYIVLAVADDAAIRLPKKLYSAFRCDEHPDPAGCLEQLSMLRRQLAAPSQLASSDFLGLLEAVREMRTDQ